MCFTRVSFVREERVKKAKERRKKQQQQQQSFIHSYPYLFAGSDLTDKIERGKQHQQIVH